MAARTAESTSYTRKPEFKFVRGVTDGHIQDVVSAVPALMSVALLA
jgi:hypothetical protein